MCRVSGLGSWDAAEGVFVPMLPPMSAASGVAVAWEGAGFTRDKPAAWVVDRRLPYGHLVGEVASGRFLEFVRLRRGVFPLNVGDEGSFWWDSCGSGLLAVLSSGAAPSWSRDHRRLVVPLLTAMYLDGHDEPYDLSLSPHEYLCPMAECARRGRCDSWVRHITWPVLDVPVMDAFDPAWDSYPPASQRCSR